VDAQGAHLIRIAFQLTHDRGAAEDIVQDALFEVCRSWRRRGGAPDDLLAYLRRAVVNEFLKKQRRRNGSLALPMDQPPFDDSVAERDTLWQALSVLSSTQRAVLGLRYYEDLPDLEIARVLGCRRATVRSLAARGLAALRAADQSRLAPFSADGLSAEETP
jgi:RNA polymerase sigma factor (sigma-70 family)